MSIIKSAIKKITFPVLYVLNKLQSLVYHLNIENTENSLRRIYDEQLSVSRFGDGEFDLINGKGLKFQSYTPEIAARLREVLAVENPPESFKTCIPFAYSSVSHLNSKSILFWVPYFLKYRKKIYLPCNKKYEYLDSQITRIYINRRSRQESAVYFSLWKKIWQDKDILIVEGSESRFGAGNDLFSGAKSVGRIICPSKNAFSVYEEILNTVIQKAGGRLVLLVLGPTATVMAYDLARKGIRALDIGNMDMEYEWFCRNVSERVIIPGKYSHEVAGGDAVQENTDDVYLSQIICRVRLA